MNISVSIRHRPDRDAPWTITFHRGGLPCNEFHTLELAAIADLTSRINTKPGTFFREEITFEAHQSKNCLRWYIRDSLDAFE